jgi:hypothetical protein
LIQERITEQTATEIETGEDKRVQTATEIDAGEEKSTDSYRD